MTSKNTVIINGRTYDASTGLPVAPTPSKTTSDIAAKKPASSLKPATSRATQAATAIHDSSPKRSQTLRRRAVKKPEPAQKVVTKRPRPTTGVRHMDIARSTRVTKFAPHPEAVVTKTTKPVVAAAAVHATPAAKPRKSPVPHPSIDAPVQPHPIAQRATSPHTRKAVTSRTTAVTAKQVKEAQIAKALGTKTPAPVEPAKKKQKSTAKTQKKRATAVPTIWKKRTLIITSAALVVLLAVFAATQIFPGLSVQVASIQSGIQASYPKYVPDGYSLSQPITHKDGRVAITFKSNSNDTKYVITQANSSWDSTAVLDNIVKKESDNNYVTTRERGLTIYTYETKAAWVNGGKLYTIDGNADLSGDQIRKIATSL